VRRFEEEEVVWFEGEVVGFGEEEGV